MGTKPTYNYEVEMIFLSALDPALQGVLKQGSPEVEHLSPQRIDFERQCSLGCVSRGLRHLVITMCMSFLNREFPQMSVCTIRDIWTPELSLAAFCYWG